MAGERALRLERLPAPERGLFEQARERILVPKGGRFKKTEGESVALQARDRLTFRDFEIYLKYLQNHGTCAGD
jgi:hypothetical protein